MDDTVYVAERPSVWKVYRLRLANPAINDEGEYVKINGRAFGPGDYVLSDRDGNQRGHTQDEINLLYGRVDGAQVEALFPDPTKIAAAQREQLAAQLQQQLLELQLQAQQEAQAAQPAAVAPIEVAQPTAPAAAPATIPFQPGPVG